MTNGPQALRQRAEQRRRPTRDIANLSPDEVRALVNELDVHQAELELQNEELRGLTLELQEVRDRYRDLFDFAPTSYLTLDASGAIVDANLAAGKLLGCDRAGLLGQQLHDFIARLDQDRFYLHQQSVAVDGANGACEMLLAPADGQPRHVAIETTAMRVPERWIRVALVDISSRVVAEREVLRAKASLERVVSAQTSQLEVSQRLNDKIAEAVPLPLWLFDFNAQALVYANARTRTGLGFGDELDLRSLHLDRIIDEADVAQLQLAWEQIEADTSQDATDVVFRIRNATGETRWISSRVTIFDRDPEGHLSRVLGVSTDITELREAEERMHRLEQEASLARDRERRELAAMLHDSIGQLLPLANTRLALARRSCDEATRTQLAEVERILREANKAASSLTFRLNPPELYEIGLIAGFESLATEMSRDHGLNVLVANEAGGFAISQAVEFAVYRVVHELLVNVAKHSGIKDTRVKVTASRGQLVVVVADRGRGFIPSAAHGRGLGLKSARERLSYLGCQFDVESDLNRGTRAQIRVPLIESRPEGSEDGA